MTADRSKRVTLTAGGVTHSFDSLAEDDVLTKSRFHHILVALHAPHGWPVAGVALAGVGLAAGVGGVWWPLARDARLGLAVAAVLLLAFAADAWLLRSLPRRGLSFASWQGQIAALALPRAAAALAAGVAGVWLGWPAALLLAAAAQLAGAAALYRGALIEPRRLVS